MAKLKNLILVIFAVLPLFLVFPIKTLSNSAGLAESPWPMYQHDPQHTGRSSYSGPIHQPILLWSEQLPECSGGFGGISIADDGSLRISAGGCLYHFDPLARKLRWWFTGDFSLSVPLSISDGSVYWGYGVDFIHMSPVGQVNWLAELNPDWVFGSSPTIGSDSSIYFVHDGLWSFTPDGRFRWFVPYTGYIAAHASPAIGLDGKIYAGGVGNDLCAYLSDSTAAWCLDVPGSGLDRTPAIGSDGTIYYPTDNSYLVAVNPTGSIKWVFHIEEGVDSLLRDGLAIASDDSIILGVRVDETKNYLYKIDSEGNFKWKLVFPTNELTEIYPLFRYPITVDRSGNIFVCPENSRCYGIAPDGSILWEFEFPLVDSIVVTASTQPVIADDGLLYIMDYNHRLYAFADPAVYPVIDTSIETITFDLQPGTANFTTTLPISSTISPITTTVSVTPEVGWLSIANTVASAPGQLSLKFGTENLPVGVYTADIKIQPMAKTSTWIDIPVKLLVSSQKLFLPGIMDDFNSPYRILFTSSWFNEAQLVSIDQNGENRTVISRDFPNSSERPILAPDGMNLAAVVYDGNTYHIEIIDVSTGAKVLEIKDQSLNDSPTWSPQSNRLAFISGRDDPTNREVYVINLDGSGLTRLTDNQLNETNLLWSPDQEKIAVKVSHDRTFLMNADGTDLHEIVTRNWQNIPVGWSPDGRYLLLESTPFGSIVPELGNFDLDSEAYTSLSDHYYREATWSPDGTKIAYVGWDREYDWDIFTLNPDGSNNMNITHDLGNEDSQPVWSPDSQWIAFSSRGDDIYNDPNFDLYVIRPDGSRLKQLTTNILLDANPLWQSRP